MGVKQGGIKYYFWVVGFTRPGIDTKSRGEQSNPHANILLAV